MRKRVIKVVLVGSPNVGKSLLFNYLTGAYTTVSNYPGTTVDITKGYYQTKEKQYEIMDTPGAYSLIPLTDEEKVTRQLLMINRPDIVLHIIDAKNIQRMLTMTIQLLEGGLPVILVLNMMDEALALGISFDCQKLAKRLGIPVIPTSAVKGNGLVMLKQAIESYQYQGYNLFQYEVEIEQTIDAIVALLREDYGLQKRLITLLLLQGDDMLTEQIRIEQGYENIMQQIKKTETLYKRPLTLEIEVSRRRFVADLVAQAVTYAKVRRRKLIRAIEVLTRAPLSGSVILLVVLYVGLYQFVGRFGAGFLVDYFNNEIFSNCIHPFLVQIIDGWISEAWLKSLLIGDYGVFSLGLRYAVAIILPIIGTFFLAFSLLEDCGYLPRLAMLVDQLLKKIGLNGRAIIPLILGFGCGSMAVVVTRTLETKRERVIATFLLAFTIPCSAQLGVILALLSHNFMALLVWLSFLVSVFIFAGIVTAAILPGERSAFYMELPPIRLPVLKNVLTKAGTRMIWYFFEILPIFILTSLFLWGCDAYGLLTKLITIAGPAMTSLGLPAQTASVFLVGFFRRDYGAAGLYDLCMNGVLDDRQLLICAVCITLFVPCVAQFAVMIKERGAMVTLFMVGMISLLAWICGKIIYCFLEVFPSILEISF